MIMGRRRREPPFTLPISNPLKNPPQRQMVFVDPDDASSNFWWPAMVIPESEIRVFFSSVDAPIQRPGDTEVLVCYFEDGSYSLVSASDTVPFCPYDGLYLTYLQSNGPRFRKDKAVILSTLYWETGAYPPYFNWLSLLPKEVRDGPRVSSVIQGSLHPPKAQKRLKTMISPVESQPESPQPDKVPLMTPSPDRSDSEIQESLKSPKTLVPKHSPVKSEKHVVMNKKKRWMSQYVKEHSH